MTTSQLWAIAALARVAAPEPRSARPVKSPKIVRVVRPNYLADWTMR
jgi:hypothetical protein